MNWHRRPPTDGVVIDSGKDQWENEEGGPDARFTGLAARIQSAARDLGLSADPARPQFLQLGIDAVDVPAVRAFWAAVLLVPCDQVRARIDTAVAAGGRIVAEVPGRCALADPEGNEVGIIASP
jgi:hypothetical protein